jgi:hypothetical protein
MPGQQYEGTNNFLNIIQGTIRQKVDQDTPGAKRREYETPAGAKGTKYEIIYQAWSGVVQGLNIRPTEFGEFLNIVFEDAILSIGLDSRYFSDFVKKFASADLHEEITIKPYDFEPEEGKRKTGLLVVQNGEKLTDYFYDFDTKEYKHGFPEPEGDVKKYSKDDWKIYFIKVKKFLKEYVEKMEINSIKKDEEVQELPLPKEEEIRIEDIPF